MAKIKPVDQHGRTRGTTAHIRYYPHELASPAYRALSCTSRALYTEIKSFHNGYNNGEVYMSVRKAAYQLGVSPNTAKKALDELCDHGFIRPNVKGSYKRKVRHATTWILTEYEFNGLLPTKDYIRWHLTASKKRKTISNFEESVFGIDTGVLIDNCMGP